MQNQVRTGVCGDWQGHLTAEGPAAELAAVLAPDFLMPLRADGHDALCPLATDLLALDRAGGLIRAVRSEHMEEGCRRPA